MPPSKPIPYGPKFTSPDHYISSLLSFATHSDLLQALCGGVHILDFLTLQPDLYSGFVPADWRIWFADVDIDDILDLLLREDVDRVLASEDTRWRTYIRPPTSLLEFVQSIRDLTLERGYAEPAGRPAVKLDRHIAVGMNVKKEHEVSHFASFANNFVEDLSSSRIEDTHGQPVKHDISHLVDFGSGQNYLGRTLAGPQYGRRVVALEGRAINIDGARRMDVSAKLAKKPVVWRNKKMWKEEGRDTAEEERQAIVEANVKQRVSLNSEASDEAPVNHAHGTPSAKTKVDPEVAQRITYLEHIIVDEDLSDVAEKVSKQSNTDDMTNGHTAAAKPQFMVMSLHSCGNLVHHGLRSLVLNPTVKAVAMIGCCYNLCTERLGPPTFKLEFRSANHRVMQESLTCDPHGFPMSSRFVNYKYAGGTGVRFNITARMMAVQAPPNWTKGECESFFTRHFYRALIQRIFLDTGFINPPVVAHEVLGGTVRGWAGGTEPIIIGSLSKACYRSFVAYVHGATKKICNINPEQGALLTKCLAGLADEDIAAYEPRYARKEHELRVVWSLMSFSAQLVECIIVADRWQFLMEQEDIATAWVQTVFDYKQSPRNLAIIGIKK